ncbi:unnamed protein product, partial [Staurois parvus]
MVKGVFSTRQTRHLPRAAFFREAVPPPGRRDGRRDTCSMGTRWDLREAVGYLMVYAEPDSRSLGGLYQGGGSGRLSWVGGVG